ncbi:Phenylalanyl-tRNA synthetase alpha chain [Richelia intracellularis HH01]|uniref:Phenylalanine--tRNA ligase alpha subunit n=1 Tax=Richelia intracellularis HH01 TaxID=1165094 RepID=M1X4P5_9NOST|nr:Phenylalanyl-tRNA synthetase alpha chain [Richelia intracellularis HH01]HAE05364.1 phenylalanine--tRNA ligase subunit alpha [Richelia sp.]
MNLPNSLEAQILTLQQEGEKAISSANTLESLEELRINYLGKKGKMAGVLRSMGQLSAEERPKIGSIANLAKETLQAFIDRQRQTLETNKIKAQIESETLDVTMPGIFRPQGKIHPINGMIDRALDIFIGMGYTVASGPEIETDYYNFEALNTPLDHPARDMQDTFYLPDGNLLRTHTSSVQIRYMETEEPPIRVVAPGRVYRRDNIDSTHAVVFHQLELLAIDEGLTFGDLKGTIKVFLQAIFGDLPIRFRASYFPFTEPSAEVDLQWNGRWLEVMGCGMVHPNMLKAVGYDQDIYTGFAAGFGIERFAMVLHQLDDIRRVYASDLRFLKQF